MRFPVLATMVLLVGCDEEPTSPAQAAPSEVEMVAVMELHYGAAIAAHDAVIEGDVSTARARLAEIESQDLPPTAPAGWRPHHGKLRAAARSAARASNLDQAADALGSVAGACGGCHAALDVGPIYFRPAPPSGEGVEAEMSNHQWASERLWEGVTGPWDDAWSRGTAALAQAQVFREAGEAGQAMPTSLLAAEQALRAAGREAGSLTELAPRAEAYGRLLTLCADCHRRAEVSHPAPSRPIDPSTAQDGR